MFNKRFCLILVLHLGFIKSTFLMLQGQKQANHCRDLHPWGRWAVHPVVTLDGWCSLCKWCDKRNACRGNFFLQKKIIKRGGDNFRKQGTTAASGDNGNDGCSLGAHSRKVCTKLSEVYSTNQMLVNNSSDLRYFITAQEEIFILLLTLWRKKT